MNKNSYRRTLPGQPHPPDGAGHRTGDRGAGWLLAARRRQPGFASRTPATINQPLLGIDKVGSVAALKTVINRYSEVTADIAAGAITVTVANAGVGGLDIKAGDLIMVIQMQGAEIKTDGDPALYGTINSLNNAGKYELATVTGVTANTITVDACGGFKNSYTAAKHVQVVRVPQYTALTVMKTGSIVPQAWDGKTGIVAAYVEVPRRWTGPSTSAEPASTAAGSTTTPTPPAL